jgi:predicted phage baseplate assembly protein
MPIEAPQLDDLRFDRTVEELVRRIPTYAPEWTDHNASDPGISLIQLFAYLAEQIGYRLNRVPEKNHVELLKLLGVRLQPAHAATTTLALLLSNPATLIGYPLLAGAKARAKKGTPPPIYETDAPIDVVPAEMVLLVTTKNPHLDDVRWIDGTTPDASTPL